MFHSAAERLDEHGYAVLPGLMPAPLLAAVAQHVEHLFRQEGDSAGSEFKQEPGCGRLANLVNKGQIFQQIIAHPDVLALLEHLLGNFKLSSLNVRRVDPRGTVSQPLHADMAAIPDDNGNWVCNALWMLDDITPENGALRVVPGSHRSGKLPQQVLADPLATHPEQVLVTGQAGTVVVINAHLWHAGTANRSDRSRTALHAFYCRRDKPQQQYQKRLLDRDVQASLSRQLREILALDDPLNDQLSADVAIRSGFMK